MKLTLGNNRRTNNWLLTGSNNRLLSKKGEM